MRPSDEKLRAVVHAATRAVEASPQVTVRDAQDVRDALRLAVAEVMKSRLPSSSTWPWKAVVVAIRLRASSDESICNWLAAT